MRLYGTEAGWDELEGNPELEQRHQEFADSIAERVLAIDDYWLPVRKAKSTLRHAQPIPGRNDPLPLRQRQEAQELLRQRGEGELRG